MVVLVLLLLSFVLGLVVWGQAGATWGIATFLGAVGVVTFVFNLPPWLYIDVRRFHKAWAKVDGDSVLPAPQTVYFADWLRNWKKKGWSASDFLELTACPKEDRDSFQAAWLKYKCDSFIGDAHFKAQLLEWLQKGRPCGRSADEELRGFWSTWTMMKGAEHTAKWRADQETQPRGDLPGGPGP